MREDFQPFYKARGEMERPMTRLSKGQPRGGLRIPPVRLRVTSYIDNGPLTTNPV